jgi:asparagine synthase (glutamine-hydrolysing)
MCGIAGIISANPQLVSARQLKKMTDAIAHRGPEGDGFWFNAANTAGLGHRKLSIIDLTTAASQPMHYRQRYTIVYNGEIYNYIELRQELMQLGYEFLSRSDTEVILAAYACWGTQCLQKFDGMFAFAIWDEQEKKLFAARDRFGEKPFYYKHDRAGNALWFASEMKAFYAAGSRREMNEKMLLLFLTHGFTDSPADASLTFDTQILLLPPASFMIFECSGGQTRLVVKNYWDIDKEVSFSLPVTETIHFFYDVLLTSVENRFRSDVPVGTSLSGGLDSSSIAAIAGKMHTGSNSYKCFSAVFPGFEKDESAYSRLVAQHCGLEQFTVTPGSENFVNDLQRFLFMQDEPVGSASVYAQFKVYELAKQHGVTVLLDGQGADEVLAGYSKYFKWHLHQLIREQPGNLQSELSALRLNGASMEWSWKHHLSAYFPGQTAKQLKKRVMDKIKTADDINPEFRQANIDDSLVMKPVVSKLNDILYFNTRMTGLPELLRYADRNSMAHGREVRLPFLFHSLVEFCFAMPAAFKISDGHTKWVLRKSMENFLPGQVVWRTDKIGFEPPQKEWMENRQVQDLIVAAREKLVDQHILHPSVLDKKIQPQDSHAADNVDWWRLSAGFLPG